MANALSNSYENSVLNHLFRRNSDGTSRDALTQPGAADNGIYVALFYGTAATVLANLEANTVSNEISGGGYVRQKVTFGQSSGGTISNDSTVTFPTATNNYPGTVTCLAVMDAATGTGVIAYGELTVEKTVTTGDTFQVAIGNLQVSLA